MRLTWLRKSRKFRLIHNKRETTLKDKNPRALATLQELRSCPSFSSCLTFSLSLSLSLSHILFFNFFSRFVVLPFFPVNSWKCQAQSKANLRPCSSFKRRAPGFAETERLRRRERRKKNYFCATLQGSYASSTLATLGMTLLYFVRCFFIFSLLTATRRRQRNSASFFFPTRYPRSHSPGSA